PTVADADDRCPGLKNGYRREVDTGPAANIHKMVGGRDHNTTLARRRIARRIDDRERHRCVCGYGWDERGNWHDRCGSWGRSRPAQTTGQTCGEEYCGELEHVTDE